jgi:hypothetical protein
MIEFYDATHAGELGFDPKGQYVSRYYVETMVEYKTPGGLNLDGGFSGWYISEENLDEVFSALVGERGKKGITIVTVSADAHHKRYAARKTRGTS